MRILHIGKYFPPVAGGMERFLGDLVATQHRAGHQASVLAHRAHNSSHPNDPPWLVRAPVWLTLAFAPISPSFPVRLSRALRQFAPDVLHFHLPNTSAFWALLLLAARRPAWVVHWHSDVERSRIRKSLRLLYPIYRIFEQALLEKADAIIATSRPYLESSEPLMRWREKCHVIPLGLAPERLPELSAHTGASHWSDGTFRVLSIGRLTYYKGFDTLIRAVAGCRDIELIIVGEGEERTHLEAMLAEIGNPANVRLFGSADDAVCNQLLASCDVFCLSSIERTEAFGIVLLEAMRYGKPLLASRLSGSGVNWVVQDGVNGRLVERGDAPAWRSSLLALAEDRQECARLGANGSRRFWSSFGIAGISRKIDGIYRMSIELRQDADWPIQDGRTESPLVVIPALNEAASIVEVIVGVRRAGLIHVLVVDDGSTDGTAAQAREAGATVLQAPLAPQGAWGAMQTGIRYAVRNGFSGVVTMDADGQHEPAYLAELINAGAAADVVIGAYPERGSWLRHIAWGWFRRITGFEFADLTSGFRYYNRRACNVLVAQEATLMDYQDIGVLLLLRRLGMRIAEIPVAMNVRKSGKSRIFSSWWTVARYMMETTLLCLARWGIKSKAS